MSISDCKNVRYGEINCFKPDLILLQDTALCCKFNDEVHS